MREARRECLAEDSHSQPNLNIVSVCLLNEYFCQVVAPGHEYEYGSYVTDLSCGPQGKQGEGKLGEAGMTRMAQTGPVAGQSFNLLGYLGKVTGIGC